VQVAGVAIHTLGELEKRVMGEVLAGGAVSGERGSQTDQPVDLGGVDVIERRRALAHCLATHRLACRLGRHRFPQWSQGERRGVAHHDLYMPPGVSTP
jgi:hypothetical protein